MGGVGRGFVLRSAPGREGMGWRLAGVHEDARAQKSWEDLGTQENIVVFSIEWEKNAIKTPPQGRS